MNSKFIVAAVALSFASASAQASLVISQWNFNSITPDNNTGSGITTPNIGNGTASVIGGVTQAFASGTASGGSSDPALTDNSGWQTTTYAAQSAGDKTRGVQFNVSTLGFSDISIRYDVRHSNTSARHQQVQYSLDGINFIDSTLFTATAGDTWFNGRSVDFSNIAGVTNNANFAFRIVSAFAPGTSTYLPSNPASSYGAGGTLRLDMVTVTGVPVPAAFWMMASGLIGMVCVRRRHTAAHSAI